MPYKDPQKEKAYQILYRKENKEAIRQYHKNRRLLNGEPLREYQRKYRKSHPSLYNPETAHKYYLKNKQRILREARKRRLKSEARPVIDQIRHPKEKIFYNQMVRNGFSLEYESRRFKIEVRGKITSYCPDFYDPKSKTYYEVVGTRQAFSHGKEKIRKFIEQYPNIKLKIVPLVPVHQLKEYVI